MFKKNNNRVIFVCAAIAMIVIAVTLEPKVPFIEPEEITKPTEAPLPIVEPEKIIEPTAPKDPLPVVIKPEETKPTTPLEPAEPEPEPIEPVILEPVGLESKYFGQGFTPSPPIIRNNLLLFGAAWSVPIGTVIFAPFEGRVTMVSRFLPDGGILMGVDVFQPATGEWENATLRFAASAHKIELLVEKGIEVEKGYPIARVASEEVIEPLLKKYDRHFNFVLDFMTKDLSDHRFYEWYSLLTLAEK